MRRLRFGRCFLASVALWTLGAAVNGPSVSAAPKTAASWTLVYSNDVLGELEPCGCRTNPMGGLARKWNWLKGLKDSSPLLIDAGDLLFETSPVPAPLREQTEVQARELLKGYDLLKHAIVVPGEKDFALGLQVFQSIRKGGKTRFIAANLFEQKPPGRRPRAVFEPIARFSRNGLRVGMVGLVGEDLTWPSELKATPALDAAKKWVPQLRKTADLVIAVTHQGFEADRLLAERVPGIDLIIGAHTQSFLQKPSRVGNTWIVQSSYRNQHPGTIELSKRLEEKDFAIHALDAGFDTNPPDSKASPKEPTVMDRHVSAFKAKVAELNAQRNAELHRQAGLPEPAKGFQTWPRCSECHLLQFDFWRKTPHAGAYHALVEAKQENNKACIGCHSVGFADPKGFSEVTAISEGVPPAALDSFLEQVRNASALKTEVKLTREESPQALHLAIQKVNKSFAPVQCENCHRVAADHPGEPSAKVSLNSCLQCHTPERAPGWYDSKGALNAPLAQEKLKKMSCPAGTTTID